MFDGDGQSGFFSRVASEAFPDWFDSELKKNKWTADDLGCAEGGGTAWLARRYRKISFCGVDFSTDAIAKAGEKYPYCQFRLGNMSEKIEQRDIIFTSNTLEHFFDPHPIFCNMIKASSKYSVFLLPLDDESGHESHFFVFHEEFFPQDVEGHSLVYSKIIDCTQFTPNFWPGKQILLIYANNSYISENEGRELTMRDEIKATSKLNRYINNPVVWSPL